MGAKTYVLMALPILVLVRRAWLYGRIGWAYLLARGVRTKWNG